MNPDSIPRPQSSKDSDFDASSGNGSTGEEKYPLRELHDVREKLQSDIISDDERDKLVNQQAELERRIREDLKHDDKSPANTSAEAGKKYGTFEELSRAYGGIKAGDMIVSKPMTGGDVIKLKVEKVVPGENGQDGHLELILAEGKFNFQKIKKSFDQVVSSQGLIDTVEHPESDTEKPDAAVDAPVRAEVLPEGLTYQETVGGGESNLPGAESLYVGAGLDEAGKSSIAPSQEREQNEDNVELKYPGARWFIDSVKNGNNVDPKTLEYLMEVVGREKDQSENPERLREYIANIENELDYADALDRSYLDKFVTVVTAGIMKPKILAAFHRKRPWKETLATRAEAAETLRRAGATEGDRKRDLLIELADELTRLNREDTELYENPAFREQPLRWTAVKLKAGVNKMVSWRQSGKERARQNEEEQETSTENSVDAPTGWLEAWRRARPYRKAVSKNENAGDWYYKNWEKSKQEKAKREKRKKQNNTNPKKPANNKQAA